MAFQDIDNIRIISAYDLQEFLADFSKAIKQGFEYDPEQPKGYPAQIGSFLQIEVYKKGVKPVQEEQNKPSEVEVVTETKGKPGRKPKEV
jgi:hypothetical protein